MPKTCSVDMLIKDKYVLVGNYCSEQNESFICTMEGKL